MLGPGLPWGSASEVFIPEGVQSAAPWEFGQGWLFRVQTFLGPVPLWLKLCLRGSLGSFDSVDGFAGDGLLGIFLACAFKK